MTLEVRSLGQLILGHADLQLPVVLVLGQLDRGRGQRHFLGTDAEEAADAQNKGFDLAVLGEQDVADVADLLVVAAETSAPFTFEASN